MDSHTCDRERGRDVGTKLFMLVKIEILFALEFPGNYFLNAYNCFKVVLPLIRGK